MTNELDSYRNQVIVLQQTVERLEAENAALRENQDMTLAYMYGVEKGNQYTECVKDLVEENKRLKAQVKAADCLIDSFNFNKSPAIGLVGDIINKIWEIRQEDFGNEYAVCHSFTLDIINDYFKSASKPYDNVKGEK